MLYKLYFKIFDKKLQCEIEAKSPEEAEYILRGKLKIVKITKVNDVVEDLKNMFGIN